MSRSRALWMIYVAFIVYGATIPFQFSSDVGAEHLRTLRSGAISTTGDRHVSLPDLVQNLVFFAPFGFLWVLADPRDRARGMRVVSGIAAGAALSVVIEALQLFTTDRVSSYSDVLANTAGAAAGGIAGSLSLRSLRQAEHWLRAYSAPARAQAWPLLMAAAGVAVGTLEPFDATLEVGSVWSKVKSFRADVWQFSPWRDEGRSALLWALLAMTLASFLQKTGRGRPARDAAAALAVVAVGAELSQFFIGSRMPGVWDVLVSLVGVGLGLIVWAWPGRTGRGFQLMAILSGTLVAATIETLSPFALAPERQPISWMPFYGYYAHTTFETLSHVMETALLYAPLGFCVCWGRTSPGPPRRSVLAAVIATFVMAVPLELGQSWIAGRFSDPTDVGVALLGALAGAGAALWAPTGLRHAAAHFDTGPRIRSVGTR